MGYTNFPNGITSFGIPLPASNYAPVFGNRIFVYGTDGSDSNVAGVSPDSPYKTIQAAVTYQAAHNSGKGDVIHVLPGTYAESITGDLNGVQIIGSGATPSSVQITPTDGGSFAGAMTNSALRNLTMYSSSSTNPEYAACRVNQMTGSIVDSCHFFAGTDTSTTATGFRIGGDEVGGLGGAAKMIMFRSSFVNNVIGTAISGDCFYWGFVMGASLKDTDTNNSNHYCIGSIIGNNRINAELNAIYLNHNQNSGGSTYIIGNTCMGAHLERGNCGEAAIKAYQAGSENVLIKVIGNMCNSDDGIVGFDSHNLMNNLSAIHLTNAVGQYPAHA